MRDAVRVAVEADDEEQTVRIHDNEGEVNVRDATFRFNITTSGSVESDCEDRNRTQSESGGCSSVDIDPRRIAAVDEVPSDGTLRCEAINGRRGTEFILRREASEDTVFAWRNSCPHKPEVPLDPGGGAIVTDEHVVCHEHGARFERGDGVCTFGPCQGKVLDEIEVTVRDGEVYLSDDRFEAGCQLADGC